ncbi:hypothetical protein GGQ04_002661 [Salinibacter ruber]|uniref:IS630 family transposase n=1 Tax=Salinibacter ruber TaxID=146919 RepID=UPI002167427B|nr:IS630 family transposase [Salinibacter ruber]MCS4047513.1 hypothetical protein [Salinibacter ruber]
MGEKLRELVSRSPQALGYERSRWTLQLLREHLREHLGEEAPETDPGLSRMLDRLGITYSRGQGYTLSPDEQFEEKRDFIDGVRTRVEAGGPIGNHSESRLEKSRLENGFGSPQKRQRNRLFYLDESSYSLHPTNADSWSPAGKQPTARRGACDRERGRLLAAMDAETGRLFYRQQESFDREDLQDLYREMVEANDEECLAEERLWVVQDNAPFHFHPDVFSLLEPQVWPRAHPNFEYPRPPTWPNPMEAARSSGELSVQLVPLPTYASWLNPIERLWRWLKQEVLHLHPHAGNWSRLKQGVRDFLDRFTDGSPALLQYTGLSST